MTTLLGSVLLQPQALARLQGRAPDEDLADEVVALLMQLLQSPAQAERLAPAARSALEAMAGRLLARWQPRMASIGAELLGLVAPLVDPLRAMGTGASAESVPALLRALAERVEDGTAFAAALSADGLVALARRLAALLGGTLGLDQNLLQTEARQLLADLRSHLAALPAASPAEAATLQALVGLIARVEARAAELPRLDLDPERVARQFDAALRDSRFADLRAQIGCLATRLAALLRAAADIADATAALAPAPTPPSARPMRAPATPRRAVAAAAAAAARPARTIPTGAPPPRSEDGSFCWYASWLYAERRHAWYEDILPGYPDDEVWLSKDGRKLVLRRANHADELLGVADAAQPWHAFTPFAAPRGAERYSLAHIPGPFLETWTRVLHSAVEGGKGLWHLIDMITGVRKHGANIPLWLWYWAKSVSAGVGTPLPSLIFKAGEEDLGGGLSKFLLTPLPAWLAVLAGSAQGHHSATNGRNQFALWGTLAGSNALTAFLAERLLFGLHDLLLSLFTLINQNDDGSGVAAANVEHGTPWIELTTFFALLIMVKAKSRDEYSYPFSWGDNPKQALWWLVIAPAIGALGSALGTLLVWALAREVRGVQFPVQLGYGALRGLRDFFLWEYIFKEGDTDGGKYNPAIDPTGAAYAPAHRPFAGYPPEDGSSPYKLPYDKGKALYVGQANLGTFSHQRFASFTPQIYAYDFAHDFKEHILCARDGTVVDYFDWIVDNTEPSFRQVMDAIIEAVGWTGTADPKRADLDAAAATPASALIPLQTGIRELSRNDASDPDRITGANFNWNFILVRHDALDTDHDKDSGGGNVTTFAIYGHGAKGGVRAAFASRGITDPRLIIGQPVRRGQWIMEAGDTGTSFHNHLHMHVLGATSAAQTTAAPPIRDSQLTDYTLPFVFAEAGRLRRLSWYESDNEPVA